MDVKIFRDTYTPQLAHLLLNIKWRHAVKFTQERSAIHLPSPFRQMKQSFRHPMSYRLVFHLNLPAPLSFIPSHCSLAHLPMSSYRLAALTTTNIWPSMQSQPLSSQPYSTHTHYKTLVASLRKLFLIITRLIIPTKRCYNSASSWLCELMKIM